MTHQNPEPAEKTRWALLLAALAVTAVIIWFEWSAAPTNDEAGVIGPAERPPRAINQSTPPRDFVARLTTHGAEAAINPVNTIKRSVLRDTLERPLFAISRRKPAPPPPTIVEPPPPPLPPDPRDLTLLGVMVGGEGAVALVRIKGRQETRSLRDGEIIDGWTINRITSRGMEVTKAEIAATIPVSSNPSNISGQTFNPSRLNGTDDRQSEGQAEERQAPQSIPTDAGALSQPPEDEGAPQTINGFGQSEQ